MELQGFSKLYMEVNASTGAQSYIVTSTHCSFCLLIVEFILFTDGYIGHLSTKYCINLTINGLFALLLHPTLSTQLMAGPNRFHTTYTL